jgi:hypothetical protein
MPGSLSRGKPRESLYFQRGGQRQPRRGARGLDPLNFDLQLRLDTLKGTPEGEALESAIQSFLTPEGTRKAPTAEDYFQTVLGVEPLGEAGKQAAVKVTQDPSYRDVEVQRVSSKGLDPDDPSPFAGRFQAGREPIDKISPEVLAMLPEGARAHLEKRDRGGRPDVVQIDPAGNRDLKDLADTIAHELAHKDPEGGSRRHDFGMPTPEGPEFRSSVPPDPERIDVNVSPEDYMAAVRGLGGRERYSDEPTATVPESWAAHTDAAGRRRAGVSGREHGFQTTMDAIMNDPSFMQALYSLLQGS